MEAFSKFYHISVKTPIRDCSQTVQLYLSNLINFFDPLKTPEKLWSFYYCFWGGGGIEVNEYAQMCLILEAKCGNYPLRKIFQVVRLKLLMLVCIQIQKFVILLLVNSFNDLSAKLVVSLFLSFQHVLVSYLSYYKWLCHKRLQLLYDKQVSYFFGFSL